METEQKVKVAAAMAEKYPGEFEPHQHRAIAEMGKGSVPPISPMARAFNGAWEVAERLWSHELGMVDGN